MFTALAVFGRRQCCHSCFEHQHPECVVVQLQYTLMCGDSGGGEVMSALYHDHDRQALFETGFEVCDRFGVQIVLQGGQSCHSWVPSTRGEVSEAILMLRSPVVC